MIENETITTENTEIIQVPKLHEMQEMAKFWINNMRLSDWDISIDILDNGDFVIKSFYPEAEGENAIDEPRKVSEIIMKSESSLDREYTIVHELSHLITNAYASMWEEWAAFFPPIVGTVVEKSFYNRNETAVNHITKALLTVRDEAYQEGYEKAMKELDLDINKIEGE